jgi:hypothetical protein
MGLSTQIFKYSNWGCRTKQMGKPPPPISFNDFKNLSQRKTTADYFQGQGQCYSFTNFVLLFTKTNWENFGIFIFYCRLY